MLPVVGRPGALARGPSAAVATPIDREARSQSRTRSSFRSRSTYARPRAHGAGRVLLIDCDTVGALAMVRGLAAAGYEPWVAAASRVAPAALSSAVAGSAVLANPAEDANSFVRQALAMAEAVGVIAIVPCGEKGLHALSRVRSRTLAPRCAVCAPDAVDAATDKRDLAGLAAAAGLKTPTTVSITAREVERDGVGVDLPAVVKPSRSQLPAGTGYRPFAVCRVNTREQAVAALRRLPAEQGLVQPYHRGTLMSLAGVFWEGQLLGATFQHAIRTWPVSCGEMAFAIADERRPELEDGATRLLRRIGWSGLFQIQFLQTDTETLLIDLNPRVYGSLALALAAGHNLPAIWLDLLLERDATLGAYQPGVTFRNEYLDARALIAAMRCRDWNVLAAADGKRATVHAFAAPGDPRPALSLLTKLANRAQVKGTPPPTSVREALR